MLTDLVQIARLGEKKREENERFRKYLKRHNFVEKQFRRLAQNVEAQIDCTACANCCRVATVRLAERDIAKLARYFRLSIGDFRAAYTSVTEDEGVILKRTDAGCVFLEGTTCQIYEVRPHNCEHFPHLLKGEGSLQARMWEFKDRASYCPIVYNTLEDFKKAVSFSAEPK